MKYILKLLSHTTANRPAQAGLRKLSRLVNFLRGMGSGAGVGSSGEDTVFRFLSPGGVVLDVGANRGDYALAVLSAIPSANLHCFEPSKKTFELLENRLHGTRAKLNNFGLGEQEALLTLFSPSDGSGLASLSKRNLAHFGINMNQEETVDIKTLDGYCLNNDIKRIDLLKIDVEGHEMDVLKGARRMLDSHKIGLVAFEFGGCNIDSRTYFQDFYYFFKERGMKSLSRITPSGRLDLVAQYTEDLECFTTTNYLVHF